MSASLPYEVWFNGDVSKQVEAGTYKECRPVFVEWVENEKLSEQQLTAYDKQAGFKTKGSKKK